MGENQSECENYLGYYIILVAYSHIIIVCVLVGVLDVDRGFCLPLSSAILFALFHVKTR